MNEVVKLKNSQLKDVKKKDKIKQIVLYCVQEALKTMSKTSVEADTFKNE